MNLKRFHLIIFLQFIELVTAIVSDYERLTRCCRETEGLQNVDQRVLEIIEANLENTTQPCEHFWNYACGSWTSAPSFDYVDNFGLVANNYADKLIKTLKELHGTQAQQDIQQLVQQLLTYFLACKSVKHHELSMVLYLRELSIPEIFGENFNWSLVSQENADAWQNFNWLRAVAYLRKYGFKEIFLQESVAFAWNNAQQYVVALKIPQGTSNFKTKYQVLQIMQEFQLIVGSNNNNNNKYYLKLANDLYNFDRNLLKLYKSYELQQQHHFITLKDLFHLNPNIDWPLYFKVLLNQIPNLQTPVEFLGNFNYLQDLLELFQQTPKNIQGIYVLIKFCQYLKDIRPLMTDQECMLQTNAMFPLGINYIYNRFLYKTRAADEQDLGIIFYLLKQQFFKNLIENKFSLTKRELQFLEDKLNLMEIKIGNLPLTLHNINHYYSSVQLNVNNFYGNHLEMLKFRTLQQHQELSTGTFKHFKLESYYLNDDISQLRNAPYFIHQLNVLIIPMLFLQMPFYHHDQHLTFKFSLVGWIMAHELSHAFDTHGLQYDARGNENFLGLQLSHNKAFLANVRCLTKNSPAISLNERLADINGLQLAWQTFTQQISNYNEEFPCGNFSFGKLFFINFAQFFCGYLPRPIDHDRDDVRVKHAVANLKAFDKVFQCSTPATENPTEKCFIWNKEI